MTLSRKSFPDRVFSFCVIFTPKGVFMPVTFEIIVALLVVGLVILLLINPFYLIRENEVGLLEKRVLGGTLPSGRVIAINGEQGLQAYTLAPGLHFLPALLYKVTRIPVIEVPQGRIATITAIDGAALAVGQLLGQPVMGHHNFQDGVAFLRNQGQKGPQVEILTPGQYRINTRLFEVNFADAVRVGTGQIGIVEAYDGTELREEQILGDAIKNHRDFQNGQAFLAHGGQRGPQLDILKPGMYYINPLLFRVTVKNATVINIGEVGVIRSNVGILPPIGEDGRTPDLVDEGYRGVLKSVLEPNTYYLNPIAYVVFPISTLNVTIDWNTANTDTPLDSITVKSRDGFSFPVDVKVVMRVPKENAPVVVSKIGSIENAVNRVIHPAIGATFRNNAERCDALAFLNNRSQQQANAKEITTIMLRDYGIETVDVLIGNVGIPEELLRTQTDRFLAKEREKTYREQQLAEETRRDLEKATANADQQKNIVAAQAQIDIARARSASVVALAEGEAQQTLLRAQADQQAYRLLAAELSREGVLALEVFKLIKEGNIKITPDITMGDQGGALGYLLAGMLKNQLKPAEVALPLELKAKA
jgi:regulator of protease activity HflC (stomatin/prohibitin superfamily)